MSGARLKEAERLGFTEAIIAETSRADAPKGLALTLGGQGHLSDLVARIASRANAG
jgi:predicted ATP-dependent serine protease